MSDLPAAFAQARAALARAPHDHMLLYACCAAAGEAAEGEMVALIEQRLHSMPAGDEIRLHDLHLLARLREKRGRAAAGLHPSNADSVEDLGFRFARAELGALAREAAAFLQRHRTSTTAAVLLAEAYAAVGAFGESERLFAQLRRAGGDSVAAVTSFDPAFHAGLATEAARAARRLPSVAVAREVPPAAERILFTAADHAYFERFGWDFVDTFARNGGAGVHLALHLFDLSAAKRDDVLARLGAAGLSISLSSETTGLEGAAARGYYHAIRYLRFWQLIERHSAAAAWIVDTDTLFGGDVARLFQRLSGHDLVLFLSPARFEVRNKVMALCAGAAGTTAARDYLRAVAGYIGHFQGEGRLPWGIDQVALYAVAAMSGGGSSRRIIGVPDDLCGPMRRPGQVLQPAKAAPAA